MHLDLELVSLTRQKKKIGILIWDERGFLANALSIRNLKLTFKRRRRLLK